MKTLGMVLAGAAVVGVSVWMIHRVVNARASGLPAAWAVVHPRAPIIPVERRQTKSGAGHF